MFHNIKIFIRGWLGYYGIAEMKNEMERWNEWLRRRIRMYIWKQWKLPRTRVENLKKLGMPEWMAYRNGNTRKGKVSPDAFIGLLADSSVKLTDINGTEKELDIDLIRLIHSWTNYFVHSGRGYWVWEVEFIRRTLQDFIFANIRII